MKIDTSKSISINIILFVVEIYSNGGVEIVNSLVAQEIFLKQYDKFILDGSCEPIEKLESKDKINLVEECRTTCEAYTNDSLIKASKVLHVLKLINSSS